MPASFYLFCVFAAAGLPAKSQYYFYNSRYYDALFTVELGITAGAMNCLTDLGGRHELAKHSVRDVNARFTHPCGGLSATLNYKGIIGLRFALTAGQVAAADSILRRYTAEGNGRFQRNLSFTSTIREAALLAEWYPVGVFPARDVSLCPYLLAGLGIFHFNPQTTLQGRVVSLPSLHTEGQGWMAYGQRRPYRLTQFTVPLGGGLKYEAGPLFSFHAELIYRLLFTDYLDDVSTTYVNPGWFDSQLSPPLAMLAKQLADRRHERGSLSAQPGDIRGNSASKDAFFSVNLTVSFVLGRNKIR